MTYADNREYLLVVVTDEAGDHTVRYIESSCLHTHRACRLQRFDTHNWNWAVNKITLAIRRSFWERTSG